MGNFPSAVKIASPHIMVGEAETPATVVHERDGVPRRRCGTYADSEIASRADLEARHGGRIDIRG